MSQHGAHRRIQEHFSSSSSEFSASFEASTALAAISPRSSNRISADQMHGDLPPPSSPCVPHLSASLGNPFEQRPVLVTVLINQSEAFPHVDSVADATSQPPILLHVFFCMYCSRATVFRLRTLQFVAFCFHPSGQLCSLEHSCRETNRIGCRVKVPDAARNLPHRQSSSSVIHLMKAFHGEQSP